MEPKTAKSLVPQWYRPALRHTGVGAVHLLLFIFSLWVAYGLRYEFHIPPAWAPIADGELILPTDVRIPEKIWHNFYEMLAFVLLVKVLVFGYFRLYAGWWQYVSIQDLVETFKASHISTAIILGAVYVGKALRAYGVITASLEVPDTVLIIDWAATIALVGGLRFLVRIIREGSRPVSPAGLTRVLIVGAGDAGEGTLRELYRLPVEKYHVVAFIDDDARKRGIRIHGVPVVGGVGDLAAVADRLNVEEVVIALPQPTRVELRRIIEVCKGRRLTFRIVPGVADLIEGRLDVSRLREVDINDILGRDPVLLDTENIGQFLADKVVLVTGAGGSIGSELCRQLVAFQPRQLVLLEQAENNLFYIDRELRRTYPSLNVVPVIADICDRCRLEDVFGRYRPHVVFHAAAHKHVPMMELNPGEAIKNNIFGSKNVVDLARESHAEAFVLISTDKAVNPTSIMGCTKRITEMYCQSLSGTPNGGHTKFVIVRFGNVLGSAGSVVPIFRDQIARGGPVTVTHPEMQRYFMTIPEATQLVIQAGAMGKGGEIMLLDMGTPVKIVDLARDMITLSGFRPDVDVKIEFLGMRPGEKLFEELRTSGEDVLPTHHYKIFIWQNRSCTPQEMRAALDRLAAVTNGATSDEVHAALQSVVPEYTPMGCPSQPSSPAPA
ncbi:MAG: polysaccharide biosynthesis protein [Planctomycetes bacterium]|nr:polysaccharide biosynthesis protein [Planctomycetota bacterium]